MSSSPLEMKERLENWSQAPGTRQSHPREEHLLPLFQVAAAGGFGKAKVVIYNITDNDKEHAVTGYLFQYYRLECGENNRISYSNII